MENKYFFDKRVMKGGFKKYGLMMLVCLPILILVNRLLGDISTGWVIFIDVVLALFVIIVLDLIVSKINERKMEKQKQKEADQKLLLKVKENAKKTKLDK